MGSSFACNYSKLGIPLLTGFTLIPAGIGKPTAAEHSKGMLLRGDQHTRSHEQPIRPHGAGPSAEKALGTSPGVYLASDEGF